nr:uncharacterized protein LOC110376413 isoform X13 [Helicoverpa armigera]
MMSKLIILVFSLLGLSSVCVGQIVQLGQCDANVPIQEDFDLESFLGTWHEISRLDNPNQPGDCSLYELENENNVLNIKHSSVNRNFHEEAKGTITQDGNTARLMLSISSFENPINFWVRSTDYSTFAITFSCENISNLQRRIHIWVLGRERAFSEMALALIYTTISNTFGIQSSEFRTIDHSDDACYILPVIEPGEPIILPGQCDPTLPVLQNFNVDRFSGVWHQISSYETPNTNGACVRSEFSRSNEGVNIVNSEVVNQQLLTLDGHATVSSTDNSAKLSVVLNIPGATNTPQDLWILASDYDTYAVAYTCINTSPTNKQVYSWILSRTRVMPQTVQTTVDQVVDSYMDLNYQYYKQTDQSDAGCFFYPEPVANQPVVFRGQCESVNVQAMQNFNIERYMGLWHNIELYPTAFQSGTCSNADYELVGSSVTVVNTQVNNERLYTVNAVGVPAASDGSAKLVVTFPIPGSDQTVSSDYWVLDTDYDSYALVYSCSNLNADEMQVSSWKLSRAKSLSTASSTAINNIINTVSVLDSRYYETMDQSVQGCFYFPEAQSGVPVVFPGQCDENIAVVQDFDLNRFQGEWHEIQSYPKAEQSGHCINHRYTPLDNTRLNLESSSVNDQFLGIINGVVARASATDNAGRLTATITVNGEAKTIPFWILNTDYTDYAFAYSCVNLNSDFRGVWSWKLSRTKQLSAAANTAIASIVASNVVLQDTYFERIDQSDEACFYLPELERGEAVILPGQCDPSIRGIPNFDITKYSGRWRLVESYGSDFQVGTCNVARYTVENPTTLSVVNSQVINAELAEISGTATISSNDGSGELTFSFPSQSASFDVKILTTDYISYALGYGCVNINNNQRRVYSWKMSRDNTLSQNAIDSMNQVIDRINVLNNRFYYYVDRTDTGCFYFPTPDPSSIVRFRGQCENIPVVTGFNTQRYLGRWYDIESYPGDFQDGTCNTAMYSAGNDVTIVNTQVVNQLLVSIRGNAVLEASTDGSAKLKATFNIGGTDVTSEYWVLDTDYESYSLVYSCRPIDDEYVQVTSWKLSRTRTLPTAAANAINNVMSNIRVLDQRYFLPRDHSAQGCFYYPEPQPGQAVIFPGHCDDNIAAVPNFDLNLFQGTWHEITSYPKDNQPGECIREVFTVTSATSMHLNSFSVINQREYTAEGVVTFATDDGSGKLQINLINMGPPVPVPYWILSTDYNDYALVYSCRNINSEQREIWSWKLSRTQQLSTAGSQAIDEAMLAVDVLRNQYFEDIDQSDAACFHLPDITPGQDVVLPGQCDENIRGIPNFDLTRFVGEWRLIESYGSRYQSGTCNVAEYRVQSSNVLAVTNSQVVNAALGSISGTATVTSTDGSGQLTFGYSSRPRTYELFVLDTDYTSYALYYGCVNMANNQRRVTSWKFSRTNTLSQAANDKINQIMDSIEVLHQPYYYTVDRTPEGCFYFPVPDGKTPVKFRGQCDENIPVVNNFDVSRYQGLWHDIESYPVPFQDGDCPNAFYAPYDSSSVTVTNTHVVNQKLDVITGLATAPADGSAKLKVTFNVQNNQFTSDYWVLDTDYDSYALVYSCTNLNADYMTVSSWKLSRTKSLSTAAATAINNIMSNIQVLDQRYYVNRDQSPEGCFYYPDPQPGQAVIFPGQCDDNIAAVPNFDLNRFQGTWHEITSYPKDNQPGECIREVFTVTSPTSMHLNSFSVINQRLFTAQGVVTFATDDGSGKLQINLINMGPPVPVPYWILTTDYIDYALVYSCRNINSDQREIWSWKLSRSRQLSAAGSLAIDNAMAAVDVLRNKYFEDIPQTDSACFYYPVLGPNDPVIFPGQCDANIPVIQNFDVSMYMGRWRLIESYYSDFQEGTCNAATYTENDDGTVAVYNTKVVEEQLNSITGSAVLASDGSGKFTVTFPNGATPVEYWILGTDYHSYALVYSCVNLPDDLRRVWTWKLSRGDSLSDYATHSINQIMNSVDVLDARYYQAVDQTDTGCFYFPEPDKDTTVVFPGQCDENIPVVANFDADRYAGTWYDIESYPTSFHTGTCNIETYTTNTDGTITVQNTQVVNQVLQSTTGTATQTATDNSAKFDVTFTLSSGPVTTKYWVLATDYDSYSLVYSCRNIDSESRAVYSWKLSRTPYLPAAAASVINEIINNVQVLEQRYYVPRSHSEESCFFYPDNIGGDVILNGQCLPDLEVPAVTSFSPSAFSGIWHEVARFPSTLQNGECTATEYLTNGNGFNVIKTSVIEEALLSTNQVAEVDATGRGVIRFESSEVPFNSIYILATDNTQYALAYSCRNIEANRKQIYSWKLSRSRAGLSEAANIIIDELVSQNIDLFEGYYRYTKQDNSACFHYPVHDELPDSIILPGPCDDSIRGIPNFNTNEYLGIWNEIARYPIASQQGQCNRGLYTSLNDVIYVQNSQVINEHLATISGQATLVGQDGYGDLLVTFNVGDETRRAEYSVLATDYINYALLYSCTNVDGGRNRRVNSWKLSRTTELSLQANNAINNVIANTEGLHEMYYQTTSQSDADCFHYPEFNNPETIVLPGPCNETITGVPNFSIANYLGDWIEVARYPQTAQTGQCNRATYSSDGANSISIVNSQVVNEALSTISGQGVLASNDGSGVLRITFNVGGENRISDYYVLATDYTTYSLVYTCTNLPEGRRQVGSWKLSRTGTLSPTALTIMDDVISDTQGLNQNYYQETSQTDDSCFYYPEPVIDGLGTSILLPGSCDTSIKGVENFNVTAFARTWYHIRRYDSVQGRSCSGTRLRVNEQNNLDITDFDVVGGELATTDYTGRVSSTDGSGKITLEIPAENSGDSTEMDIYILATNYNEYALAYSCENVGTRRRVRAWQLSTDRTMPASGVAVINELEQNMRELHNPYFNQVPHNEDCEEPSSAILFKSSIIVIFICTVLQALW